MSGISEFLSDSRWVGVQGIAAILALVAVIIAVIDFMIRMDDAQPQAMSFTMGRTRINDFVEVKISAQPMGPSVLYEPEWVIFGMEAELPEDLPSVMTARDSTETITIRVPAEKLSSVWVGIAWVETQGRGTLSRSFARCSRLSLDETPRHQWWVTYRWWRWPRRSVGRWVDHKERKRSRMKLPTS